MGLFDRLTTPVAYITEAPNDPFVKYDRIANSPGGGGWGGGIKAPYFYQTTRPYRLADQNNVGTNAEKCLFVAFRKGYTWYMGSVGPFRLKALNGEIFYHGGMDTSNAMLPYDPTNGTVSRGYIYRSNRGKDDSQIPTNPMPATIPNEW